MNHLSLCVPFHSSARSYLTHTPSLTRIHTHTHHCLVCVPFILRNILVSPEIKMTLIKAEDSLRFAEGNAAGTLAEFADPTRSLAVTTTPALQWNQLTFQVQYDAGDQYVIGPQTGLAAFFVGDPVRFGSDVTERYVSSITGVATDINWKLYIVDSAGDATTLSAGSVGLDIIRGVYGIQDTTPIGDAASSSGASVSSAGVPLLGTGLAKGGAVVLFSQAFTVGNWIQPGMALRIGSSSLGAKLSAPSCQFVVDTIGTQIDGKAKLTLTSKALQVCGTQFPMYAYRVNFKIVLSSKHQGRSQQFRIHARSPELLAGTARLGMLRRVFTSSDKDMMQVRRIPLLVELEENIYLGKDPAMTATRWERASVNSAAHSQHHFNLTLNGKTTRPLVLDVSATSLTTRLRVDLGVVARVTRGYLTEWGGYKWKLQMSVPFGDVPLLVAAPSTSTTVPSFATVVSLQEGREKADQDRRGIISLPVSGSKCGQLSGTTSRKLVDGLVSFDDIVIDRKGIYFIRFSTVLPSFYRTAPDARMIVDSVPFVVASKASYFVLDKMYAALCHYGFSLCKPSFPVVCTSFCIDGNRCTINIVDCSFNQPTLYL